MAYDVLPVRQVNHIFSLLDLAVRQPPPSLP